jgi:hypothetical protein
MLDSRADGERVRLRTLLSRLAAFRPTWVVLAAGGVLLLGGEIARGRSPLSLLGAYRVVVGATSLSALPRWFVYHLADLDLYLGIVPFAASCLMVPLALRRGEPSRRLRVFVVAALSLVIWMTLLVAAFSTSSWGLDRLHERNLFYVVPLFVILMLVWLDRGAPRPRLLTAAALVVAAGLPAALPYREVLISASFDALALAPWLNKLVSISALPLATAVFGAVLASLLLLKRPAAVLVLVVVSSFYLTTIAARTYAYDDTARAAVGVHRDWVDRAVGPDARVVALWLPSTSVCAPRREWGRRWSAVWETEFFNRSVRGEYFVGRQTPDNLPAVRLRSVRDRLVPVRKRLRAQYVVADRRVRLALPVVAREAKNRETLYRLSGPLRLSSAGDCAATTDALSAD